MINRMDEPTIFDTIPIDEIKSRTKEELKDWINSENNEEEDWESNLKEIPYTISSYNWDIPNDNDWFDVLDIIRDTMIEMKDEVV